MKLVESVEKLFLCAFLTYNKLDIVDQQYVDISVFITELIHRGIVSVTDRVNQFICKYLRRYIKNLHARIVRLDKVSNGMHQVGLAKSDSSI